MSRQISTVAPGPGRGRRAFLRARRKRIVWGCLALLLALVVLAAGLIWRQFDRGWALQDQAAAAAADYHFDIFSYEVGAIAGKVGDSPRRLGVRLTPAEQRQLVESYHDRAGRSAWLERRINRIYANPDVADPDAASANLRAQLADLRDEQAELRPLVEAVLERQVTAALEAAGLTTASVIFPPVRFNFSDMPHYLILSPREQIRMEAGVYLQPQLDLAQIEAIEQAIAQQFGRSTLIEGLGGLGVWPTMVMDEASLSWILATVVHEWVHTYLAFRPLGWGMFDSGEMNTINETVATIIGDELGQALAEAVYGIPAPAPPAAGQRSAPPPEPEPDRFDFVTEMRRTRLHVDALLDAGEVAAAEAYMEERRQLFVANGFPLRKLNQAYFAFHGSYATGPASSDPIGPKLVELRARMPDLATFLRAVQGIRRPSHLDDLLAVWPPRE